MNEKKEHPVKPEAHHDHKKEEQDLTVIVSREEFEGLKARAAECDASRDKYLRAHAEFENIKKRMEKDKADFARFANERLVFDFLPIVDNLEIAERYIKEAKDFKAVREGVDMIQAQIMTFLKDIGVEKVKTAGEKFDPHFHEALEMVESGDKDDGVILEEVKPGYKLNDRLLRPASVKVAKKKIEEKKE